MPDIDLDSALSTAVNHLIELSQGDPDRLANFLEDAGVTGVRNNIGQCPLAKWLSKNLDGATMTVDKEEISAALGGSVLEFQEATVDVPEVLGVVIQRFDKGEYPALILGDPDV